MSRTKLVAAAGALLLAALIPTTTLAGIDPSPFDVAIWNRSDTLSPESPFYGKSIESVTVYVQYDAVGSAPIVKEYYFGPGVVNYTAPIAAGDRHTFSIARDLDPALAGRSITGWGITARMGIDPVPFNVCAMKAPAPEKPATPPMLPPSLLAEFNLYGFASPATLVGQAMISTEAATTNCAVDAAWKNHGQYVRCVALWVGDLAAVGQLTEEEADAIVNAAAHSAVGK